MNPDQFPKAVQRVPNESVPQSLDSSMYEKRGIGETLSKGFSATESQVFQEMSMVKKQEELNDAIASFNSVSGEKSAEALGISLDEMLIEPTPIRLANGFSVVVSRTRRGVVSFTNPVQ